MSFCLLMKPPLVDHRFIWEESEPYGPTVITQPGCGYARVGRARTTSGWQQMTGATVKGQEISIVCCVGRSSLSDMPLHQ